MPHSREIWLVKRLEPLQEMYLKNASATFMKDRSIEALCPEPFDDKLLIQSKWKRERR